ncbi:MAG: glucose-6-phosphate dehydrogenase [Bacteroidales bacterium]
MSKKERPENQILVIFGASGDLTKRKLIPSLFHLYRSDKLPKHFVVLGIGRSSYTNDEYREYLTNELSTFGDIKNADQKTISNFIKMFNYLVMDPSNMDEYPKLKVVLEELSAANNIAENYLYYLATPPALYKKIPVGLKSVGLSQDKTEKSKKRIIIEKPFGYNLKTAVSLNHTLMSAFKEDQIFRIDHYLGKETVLNVMALRFANGIFEPLWNRNYIDHIEITAVENIGIESRAGFYDEVGALRDMVQNHLIQLVAIAALEPPIKFDADNFRNEVVKVYNALRPLDKEDILKHVVRGQYVASGTHESYREMKGVKKDSRTETYVAMKLFIDNWRWEGVPFYIRTGKQLPTKVSEIVVHFKQTPHMMFKGDGNERVYNKLIIRIQPNEGVLMRIAMKTPGSGYEVKDVSLDFTYDKLGGVPTGDAYARLIEDCMKGESTLFTRSDAVEASWRYFDTIIQEWENNPTIPLYGYPAGTWGPLEADKLMTKGFTWTNPCKNLTNTDLYCEL